MKNIHYDETKYALDPEFKPFVDKLALNNSHMIFTLRGYNEHNLSANTKRSMIKSSFNTEHPEGKRYIRKMRVYQNEQLVGEINADLRYNRSKPSDIIYGVISERIDNDRGARNMTVTSKLDAALRNAKRYLVPKNMDEVFDAGRTYIKEHYLSSMRDLRMPIHGGVLSRHSTVMQLYIYNLLNDIPIPDKIKEGIEVAMADPKYASGMREYNLAEEMVGLEKHLVPVVVHGSNYLYRLPEDNGTPMNTFSNGAVVCTAYENLSSLWQDRVAVLQLMEDHELVRGVGYRANSTHFLILDKEVDMFANVPF
jgi:hypothetical protein